MALTRETAKKLKPRTKEIPVPELADNETVFVRKLSTEGLGTILASADSAIKKDDIPGVMKRMSLFAQRFMCDEKGELLYGSTEKDLLAIRQSFPMEALVRVFSEGMAFNGLDDEAIAKREAKLTGPLARRSSKSRVSVASHSKKRKRRPRKKT